MSRTCRVILVGFVAATALSGPWAWAQESPWDYISVFNQEDGERAWEARYAAVRGLVQMGETAFGALMNVLGHQNPVVREHAALALGRIGAGGAVDALIGLLSDPEASVRGTAAEALGNIGDARAVAPLLAALASEDEANVRGAEVALGALKSVAETYDWRQIAPRYDDLIGSLISQRTS